MIELKDGMVAHTKKIDLHVGNTVFSYTAPRGQSFVVLLLGAEKPSGDGNGIQIDEWLNKRGWKLEE
ncbi:hypothetical protein [Staphylococcus haemolyticus]|jgi:hypothetical protein|uniref:Conserved membrane protein n=1 Tax=Cronobacter phage vB_CsaM_GAP31 TaxID=1141135 RepID=K4FAU1_9CAUD|nr:hypothetical protein [Staphylococcus haemolyticus]YP_006986844.1 hypothetical protein GAP31_011 [Cronobacter phage vB_CsaM_GAP31]AFC21189.1 conserved membrane protein [Cronobacter phage vB_CsaM_GAP31]MCC3723674.1 hypothetical protein [Staphylococcus haemolyticus]